MSNEEQTSHEQRTATSSRDRCPATSTPLDLSPKPTLQAARPGRQTSKRLPARVHFW